jgi:hypothetical protein
MCGTNTPFYVIPEQFGGYSATFLEIFINHYKKVILVVAGATPEVL